MEVQVNYLAVFIASFSGFAVGGVWYSKLMFVDQWAKLARVDMKKNENNVARPMITAFIATLVTAYVVAYATYLSNQFFQNSFLQDALMTAFWLWLGLTAARFVTHDAFEGRPTKLTLINCGNELVTVLLIGLIIGLFGA